MNIKKINSFSELIDNYNLLKSGMGNQKLKKECIHYIDENINNFSDNEFSFLLSEDMFFIPSRSDLYLNKSIKIKKLMSNTMIKKVINNLNKNFKFKINNYMDLLFENKNYLQIKYLSGFVNKYSIINELSRDNNLIYLLDIKDVIKNAEKVNKKDLIEYFKKNDIKFEKYILSLLDKYSTKALCNDMKEIFLDKIDKVFDKLENKNKLNLIQDWGDDIYQQHCDYYRNIINKQVIRIYEDSNKKEIYRLKLNKLQFWLLTGNNESIWDLLISENINTIKSPISYEKELISVKENFFEHCFKNEIYSPFLKCLNVLEFLDENTQKMCSLSLIKTIKNQNFNVNSFTQLAKKFMINDDVFNFFLKKISNVENIKEEDKKCLLSNLKLDYELKEKINKTRVKI